MKSLVIQNCPMQRYVDLVYRHAAFSLPRSAMLKTPVRDGAVAALALDAAPNYFLGGVLSFPYYLVANDETAAFLVAQSRVLVEHDEHLTALAPGLVCTLND